MISEISIKGRFKLKDWPPSWIFKFKKMGRVHTPNFSFLSPMVRFFLEDWIFNKVNPYVFMIDCHPVDKKSKPRVFPLVASLVYRINCLSEVLEESKYTVKQQFVDVAATLSSRTMIQIRDVYSCSRSHRAYLVTG